MSLISHRDAGLEYASLTQPKLQIFFIIVFFMAFYNKTKKNNSFSVTEKRCSRKTWSKARITNQWRRCHWSTKGFNVQHMQMAGRYFSFYRILFSRPVSIQTLFHPDNSFPGNGWCLLSNCYSFCFTQLIQGFVQEENASSHLPQVKHFYLLVFICTQFEGVLQV